MLETHKTDLIKKLFPGGVWLDGKLQLCIHGGHPDVDLEKRKRNLNFPVPSSPVAPWTTKTKKGEEEGKKNKRFAIKCNNV